MSFMDNIKDMADKASLEIKRVSEEAKEKNSEVNAVQNTELMGNLRSMASKAGDGIKKASQKAHQNITEEHISSGGDLKSRHKMNDVDLQEAWARANEQMLVELTPEVESYLQDIIFPDEQVIYKIRNSSKGKSSQLVLTERSLYIVNKGVRGGQGQDLGNGILGMALAIGQISVRIYPLKQILAYEIKPMKGLIAGHFQVFTSSTSEDDNETKLIVDNKLGYFKLVLLYRKIAELKGF